MKLEIFAWLIIVIVKIVYIIYSQMSQVKWKSLRKKSWQTWRFLLGKTYKNIFKMLTHEYKKTKKIKKIYIQHMCFLFNFLNYTFL